MLIKRHTAEVLKRVNTAAHHNALTMTRILTEIEMDLDTEFQNCKLFLHIEIYCKGTYRVTR